MPNPADTLASDSPVCRQWTLQLRTPTASDIIEEIHSTVVRDLLNMHFAITVRVTCMAAVTRRWRTHNWRQHGGGVINLLRGCAVAWGSKWDTLPSQLLINFFQYLLCTSLLPHGRFRGPQTTNSITLDH